VSARGDASSPIYLVGFMGVGKSTIGRALADQLGWEFADTDAMVEAAQGRDIETLFRDSGEGSFREAEWEALRSLAARRRLVVATGGGLFLSVVHRAFVRAHGVSCWLDAPLHVVASRAGDASSRPLWPRGDDLDRRAFFERRRAAYALADLRVDASAGPAADVARAIATRRIAFFH
jgi:shikimate kinase